MITHVEVLQGGCNVECPSPSNVLPLLGVTMGDSEFVMVSEWMENGNINEFIKAHRDANRFDLVRPFSCRPQPLLIVPSHSSKTSLGGRFICTVRQ